MDRAGKQLFKPTPSDVAIRAVVFKISFRGSIAKRLLPMGKDACSDFTHLRPCTEKPNMRWEPDISALSWAGNNAYRKWMTHWIEIMWMGFSSRLHHRLLPLLPKPSHAEMLIPCEPSAGDCHEGQSRVKTMSHCLRRFCICQEKMECPLDIGMAGSGWLLPSFGCSLRRQEPELWDSLL